MADELNPTASSQPATAAGPNGSGEPAKAGSAPAMTPSQDKHFYNETQKLAADRRAFEAEKQAFFQKQAQNPSTQNQYGQPQGFVPGQGQGGFGVGPQAPGMQQPQPGYGPPPSFGQLVEQFGREGAETIMTAFNQMAGPVQQEFSQARAMLTQTQLIAIETQINARGKETYGNEWNENGKEVMDLIKVSGIPLEKAWFAVTGEKAYQKGRDEAYQAQQQKGAAQVAQPGGPAIQNGQAPINSFGDAFQSALKEHQTY